MPPKDNTVEQPPVRLYHYYIAFAHTTSTGVWFGSLELRRDEPIRDSNDIKAIAAAIAEEDGLKEVVVINWREFDR